MCGISSCGHNADSVDLDSVCRSAGAGQDTVRELRATKVSCAHEHRSWWRLGQCDGLVRDTAAEGYGYSPLVNGPC